MRRLRMIPRPRTDLSASARGGVPRLAAALAFVRHSGVEEPEWAYNRPFTNNDEGLAAHAPRLKHYNTARAHTALGGHPPISPRTVTNVTAGYF